MSCAKTAELIEMPFAVWNRVGPRKRVLDGRVHIGATWRIQSNRPCAAAMRPYVKLFDAFDYLLLLLITAVLNVSQHKTGNY